MVIKFRPLDYSRDWEWVNKHLPLNRSENGTGIAAYNDESGELVAATVMESWTPTSVVAHIIVTNSIILRHGFIEECLWYAFTVGKRIKMYGHVRSDNDACLKLCRHIGFKEIIRLEDAYDVGVDNVLVELHRDETRYWAPEARRVANG